MLRVRAGGRAVRLSACAVGLCAGLVACRRDSGSASEARAEGSAATHHAEPAPAAGKVSLAGRMSVPRACHTATLLADGRVLIAGGCTTDGCETTADGRSAEIYDPTSGAFRRTGSMATARASQTATRLGDGRVLIAGGWDGASVTATAELYDPPAGHFVAAGSMSTGREGHTATLLGDGRVLIAGGEDGSHRLATAELFDPKTATFVPTGRLITPRAEHAAALLPDGRVLLSGGSRARGQILASAEIFDPATGTFTSAGDMTTARHKLAAVALRDGRVWIVGGADARDGHGQLASTELFDAKSARFEPGPPLGTARYKILDAVALLPSGSVLVGGGARSVELLDPSSGTAAPTGGEIDAPRAFATATLLSTGDALIAGGYDWQIRPTDGAWLYRPAR